MIDIIKIRQATIHDIPVLREFEQGVIEAERPFDCTLKQTETQYYNIEGMIDAPHIQLLVAETNKELIGCGYARIEDSKSYLQHRQHSYLGFMYVKPMYRGKGVNQRIIQELKMWSIEKGITELRLEVYCQNESAIKAYEKAGFSPHMIEMRLGILILNY